MEKYIVMEDDYLIAVCDTQADAEELVLSMAESEVYESYFYEIHRYEELHNDYIRAMMDARDDCNERNHVHAMRMPWVREQQWLTWYGWLLNDVSDYYLIKSAPYFGGNLDVLCAPTLDVEPVRHGYWIEGRDGSCMCSECGKVSRYEIGYYCSKCGAKMDLPN